jgi:hypothetical protein
LTRLLRTEARDDPAGDAGLPGTVPVGGRGGDQPPLHGGLDLTVAMAPGQLDPDVGMDSDHDVFTSLLLLTT